jgi:hypothetical protein
LADNARWGHTFATELVYFKLALTAELPRIHGQELVRSMHVRGNGQMENAGRSNKLLALRFANNLIKRNFFFFVKYYTAICTSFKTDIKTDNSASF